MKRKILIIHDSMNAGGAERVLATLLSNLDAERFDVTLLLLYKEGVFLKSLPSHIEVLGLSESSSTFKERLVNHFYRIRNRIRRHRASKLLGGREFDVTVSFMEGPAAKLHQQFMHVSPVNLSWVHTDVKNGRWYDFWFKEDEERRFYQKLDRIAFVSKSACDAFKSVYKTDAQTTVIYNPVDVETIRCNAEVPVENNDSRFTIVNVGRCVYQKNQGRLLEVARILKSRGLDFRILILGNGPLEAKLKQTAATLDVAGHVEFMGYVGNPYPVMKTGDVFCMTSDVEGFGMVVAESLALSVPVVTTPVSGVTEMLARGGGIVTSFIAEEIADTLELLMMHRDRLEKLKQEAQTSVAQFDLQKVMADVSRFLS